MVKTERQRHISFEIVPLDGQEITLGKKKVSQFIWREFLDLFGVVEAARAGIWIEEYDKESHRGILRCAHRVKNKIITALAFWREIGSRQKSQRVVVLTHGTSGSVKRVKEKIARGNF